MKNTDRENSLFSGKVFYIAIILSLLAVIATTIIAIGRTMAPGPEAPQLNTNIVEQDAAQTSDEKADVKKEEQISSKKPASAIEEQQNEGKPAKQTNKKVTKCKFFMPIKGEIIQEFSKGELVKSETMGDWRTHDGIDIAAKQSTPVKSAADGTVCEINNDNIWGTCIAIDHGSGMKSYYFGLNEKIQVKLDQSVKSGDVIGSVGTSNQLENALPEHLHFGMKKEEVWVNPMDYLK